MTERDSRSVDTKQDLDPVPHGAGVTPTVSVVLPALNERAHIRDCLDSLAGQDYPEIAEILVCDGGSTDGTRDIVRGYGGIVRLVDNAGITAAAGLNVGLREATGAVYCRGDAHTLYDADYVRRCVEVLVETGASNVGGTMRPVGATSFGRAVAAVTSSPYGVGPGRFHYSGEREDVDTVYLGCWWKTTLEQLDGWDEANLQWGAEDHELNLRIHSQGGRIVLDPGIRSWYFPRQTPRSLARQYRNYGLGKASTLFKHRTLPTWRPLAPAALVVLTVLALVLGRGVLRFLPPLGHVAAASLLGLRLGGQDGVAPHRAAAAILICHWCYGVGFWQGIGRGLRRLPFQSRPSGHR